MVSGNMKINGLTALVTGANRGLGRAFVQALRDAGCAPLDGGRHDGSGQGLPRVGSGRGGTT